MKATYGIGKVRRVRKNTALAIGVFDGLHIGHQKLIRAAVKKAKAIKGEAVVMTFSPHPVQVLQPKKVMPFIVSMPHRLQLMEQLGVARCIIIKFTKTLSRLSPREFIKRYIVDELNPRDIFVGSDFRFGSGRSGTVDVFKEAGREYGFKVNPVSEVARNGRKIGSSRIRQLIMDGKLKAAARLLGRPVSVMGQVVKGDGRGKGLGFPTANLQVNNVVIPPVGVYAVKVRVSDKKYKGMANVGTRPSFKSGNVITVEVHLFRFNRNLYGRTVTVEFIQKIRKERKFASKEALATQLKRDEAAARRVLKM